NCHCSSVSCLRVTIAFLPDPPSRRTRIGKIDHDITQALVRSADGRPSRHGRSHDEAFVRTAEGIRPERCPLFQISFPGDVGVAVLMLWADAPSSSVMVAPSPSPRAAAPCERHDPAIK
ncbi:hypothetical protein, partial [Streptomyces sp. NPDC002671]